MKISITPLIIHLFWISGKRKIYFGSIAHINNICKGIFSKEILKVMIYVRKSMAVYMLFPLNWFQFKANTILLKSLHVLFKFYWKIMDLLRAGSYILWLRVLMSVLTLFYLNLLSKALLCGDLEGLCLMWLCCWLRDWTGVNSNESVWSY